MAKPKKEKPVIENIDSQEPIEQLPEETETMQQEGIVNPVYIPDIPAQMIVEEEKVEEESDEILFLLRILDIQESGGFGRHLHQLINERIKVLRNGN